MSDMTYILVAGAGDLESNGIYTCLNPEADVFERVWYLDDPARYMFSREVDGVRRWILHTDTVLVDRPLYSAADLVGSPINSTGMLPETGEAPGPSVSAYAPEIARVTESAEDLAAGVFWHKLTLKDALTAKGVEVPEETELYKYPDLVRQVTGGGETTFYKCVAVGGASQIPAPVLHEALADNFQGNWENIAEAPVFTEVDGRKCLQLDTEHNYSFPSDGLPSGSSARTLAAWIYTRNDYGYSFFVSYGRDSANEHAGVPCIETYYTNLEAHSGCRYENVALNTWFHVAVIYDASGTKLYVNGKLERNCDYSVDTITAGYPLLIGGVPSYLKEGYSRTNNTNGYISDLRIYDFALSEEQITEIYEGLADTPETPLAPDEWYGNKAILMTEDGKKFYTFEEAVTTGLKWGDGFTPEINGVYDAEAMIKATLFEKQVRLVSTPENMAGYENDEWVVSSDDEFQTAWHAFDNDPTTIWATSYTSGVYLQWQNKNQQVLVKQLTNILEAGHVDRTYEIILEGSDDGVTWHEIGQATFSYEQNADGFDEGTVTFPDNNTPYSYHRMVKAQSRCRDVVGTLVAKSVID